MADNEVTKRTRVDVEGAIERLSVYEEKKPSALEKLHPKHWPIGVKAAAVAAATAALVSAKVPAAVASAIASWLFGG